MSKKFDEVQLYKEKILESGIPEKKLKQLIKEKKTEKNQILGKNAIDDKGALSLIAGDLGISLVPQSSISTKPKSELERYLDYRDNTRETCLYILETLEPKIDDLIKQVKKIEIDEKLKNAESNGDNQQIDFLKNKKYKELEEKYLNEEIAYTEFIYHDLLKVKKLINSQLLPSLFKNDDDWIRPKDYTALYKTDSGLFEDIPKLFKEIMDAAYTAFLRQGHRKHISTLPNVSGFFQIHQTFENENSYIRYNGRNNPYRSPTSNPAHWVRDITAKNEFLQCFKGTVELIDSFRNYDSHKQNTTFKDRFDLANRVIKDPLTGMSSPGNFIILANNSVNLIYEIMELIQVWLDSKEIEKEFS